MVRNSTGNRRLNGLYPLSYLGDNPTTPPNFFSLDRDPTVNDWQDVQLCDLWLNEITEGVWILVSLNGNQATWVQFTGGVGSVLSLTGDTGGPVLPVANNINVLANTTAGASVRFVGATPNLTLNVTDALNNTFVGLNAGNSTLTGNSNVTLGRLNGSSLTSGTSNTLIGETVGTSITTGAGNMIVSSNGAINLTTGNNNTFVGYNGAAMTTGSNNTLLGAGTGAAYTTTESNNIAIGYSVGVAGDNNRIRIGVDGNGAGQQNSTTIAGDITGARSINATTYVQGTAFYANGDPGGVALTNAFTNATQAVTAGVNTLAGTALGGGAQVNAGYIKFYVGATAVYVPYFLTP